MQFTPQQLAGGAKYSAVTKIGNWQEETALEEAKIENFKKRSATGSLSLRKLENKMSICSEIVPLSSSSDGCMRFGDSVILQHESSSSILACDPFEQVPISQDTFFVTTIANPPVPLQSKARNTFRIMRPPKHLQNITDRDDDSILRVGQPFLLACSEALLVPPPNNGAVNMLLPTLYLCSTKKNERTATKRSNRQMVFMNTAVDADAIWFVSVPSKGKLNGTERFLSVGSPVTGSISYQLTHRQTNMYLTCDTSFKFSTEFGVEYEAFADRSTACGKIGLMVSEFKGLSTSQTLTKPDAANFSWHFVSANDPVADRSAASAPSPDSRVLTASSLLSATPDRILKAVQDYISSKGVDAYWNLRLYLLSLIKKLNLPNYSKIDRIELKNALVEWGINIFQQYNSRYLDMILDNVDKGKLGLIDLKDFFSLIHGSMSSKREKALIDVFSVSLDPSNSGFVLIPELRKKFRGEDHPLVSLGGYSDQFAFEHLLQSCQIPSIGSEKYKFTLNAFLDYYGDLSAAIEDDDYFLGIVRSNWN
jgi:Ca2+-binding EF-hand superfamily protein